MKITRKELRSIILETLQEQTVNQDFPRPRVSPVAGDWAESLYDDLQPGEEGPKRTPGLDDYQRAEATGKKCYFLDGGEQNDATTSLKIDVYEVPCIGKNSEYGQPEKAIEDGTAKWLFSTPGNNEASKSKAVEKLKKDHNAEDWMISGQFGPSAKEMFYNAGQWLHDRFHPRGRGARSRITVRGGKQQ